MNKQLLALEQTLGISRIDRIEEAWINQLGLELYLKRDDLLHPIISGNKWRKLKYILDHALSSNTHSIVSMGGAYSNHLHALAYVAKQLGIKTTAKIRGECPAVLNPTLVDLMAWGMQLDFVSRSDYRELRQLKHHDSMQTGEYWLPEGGAISLALRGVAELVEEINIDYDVLCAPCGTATSLAGMINTVDNDKQVLGFAALKGASFLTDDVKQLLKSQSCHNKRWFIHLDYHFGGFAKVKPELIDFIQRFEQQHQIPLEPIYTGKMLYGLYTLMQQGYFKSGQKIIAIHTGGLQGKRGFTAL